MSEISAFHMDFMDLHPAPCCQRARLTLKRVFWWKREKMLNSCCLCWTPTKYQKPLYNLVHLNFAPFIFHHLLSLIIYLYFVILKINNQKSCSYNSYWTKKKEVKEVLIWMKPGVKGLPVMINQVCVLCKETAGSCLTFCTCRTRSEFSPKLAIYNTSTSVQPLSLVSSVFFWVCIQFSRNLRRKCDYYWWKHIVIINYPESKLYRYILVCHVSCSF